MTRPEKAWRSPRFFFQERKHFLQGILDPTAFEFLEGEANSIRIQPCVNRCAATALAGLTAARHALEGRLFASIQNCVEDHARYLLRLVSVSPVPPEITFTPVASGFSHYNDIRLGTSTLPADPYSWMIGWATLG